MEVLAKEDLRIRRSEEEEVLVGEHEEDNEGDHGEDMDMDHEVIESFGVIVTLELKEGVVPSLEANAKRICVTIFLTSIVAHAEPAELGLGIDEAIPSELSQWIFFLTLRMFYVFWHNHVTAIDKQRDTQKSIVRVKKTNLTTNVLHLFLH